jgi:hypothetical protein
MTPRPSQSPRWLAVEDGLASFGCADTAAGRRRFVARLDDRAQGLFLRESVEQSIAPDNPPRVIDAFVDGLDVRPLGLRPPPPDDRRPFG